MKKNMDYRNMQIGIVILIILVHAAFLLWHIDYFPNVFFDEANGMYDSWCMASFGTDSNLISFPVYLQSFSGQGQSVFYATIAACSMRVFGYTLFAYRLPLVLISILHLVLLALACIKRAGNGTAVWIVAATGLSPYLLDAARFGMDCNVSPFLYSAGTLLLYLGITEDKQRAKKIILLMSGGIVLSLTAYSYNVSWIVLPIFLLTMAVWMCAAKLLSFRDLLTAAAVIILVSMPIIIFAVRSNIPSLNHTVKILWWTSPALPNSRAAASMIDLTVSPVRAILENIYAGWKMFAAGSDRLSWNSVGSFGPYYRFVLPFFLIGFGRILGGAIKKNAASIIIISQFIGMLPVCLLVIPNYNHWIFLHLPVLVTSGLGIDVLFKHLNSRQMRKIYAVGMSATYILSSLTFFRLYFDGSRNTGWDSGGREKLMALHVDEYDTIRFVSDQNVFLYQIRFYLPVSPYDFQKTKDHPFSETEFWMENSYSNFRRLSPDSLPEPGNDLYMIQEASLEDYSDLLNSMVEKDVLTLNGTCYHIYESGS